MSESNQTVGLSHYLEFNALPSFPLAQAMGFTSARVGQNDRAGKLVQKLIAAVQTGAILPVPNNVANVDVNDGFTYAPGTESDPDVAAALKQAQDDNKVIYHAIPCYYRVKASQNGVTRPGTEEFQISGLPNFVAPQAGQSMF